MSNPRWERDTTQERVKKARERGTEQGKQTKHHSGQTEMDPTNHSIDIDIVNGK